MAALSEHSANGAARTSAPCSAPAAPSAPRSTPLAATPPTRATRVCPVASSACTVRVDQRAHDRGLVGRRQVRPVGRIADAPPSAWRSAVFSPLNEKSYPGRPSMAVGNG